MPIHVLEFLDSTPPGDHGRYMGYDTMDGHYWGNCLQWRAVGTSGVGLGVWSWLLRERERERMTPLWRRSTVCVAWVSEVDSLFLRAHHGIELRPGISIRVDDDRDTDTGTQLNLYLSYTSRRIHV